MGDNTTHRRDQRRRMLDAGHWTLDTGQGLQDFQWAKKKDEPQRAQRTPRCLKKPA